MLSRLIGSVSVKVAHTFRETGSKYACKWSSPVGIYNWKNRLEKKQEETSEETMPVFVEVTPTAPLQADVFHSSLHIAWNEIHFDITSKEDADLAAYFIRQVQHLC